MTLAAVALLMLLATPANAETACKPERDQPAHHWRWRMIDGKKCWYIGRDRRPKSQLVWERVIERRFYSREELAPHEPPAGPDKIEYHPDEMINSFDERWRLR